MPLPIKLDNIFARSALDVLPATAGDEHFMERVFCSTREAFMQLNLPPAALEMLLSQQYQLQQQAYRQQWPDAVSWTVHQLGLPIGKITLVQAADALHLVDIALLPEARGKGIGRALIRLLQTEAGQQHLAVTLSVDNQNRRARKFYEALGFVLTGASATHDFMRWQASASAVVADVTAK